MVTVGDGAGLRTVASPSGAWLGAEVVARIPQTFPHARQRGLHRGAQPLLLEDHQRRRLLGSILLAVFVYCINRRIVLGWARC